MASWRVRCCRRRLCAPLGDSSTERLLHEALAGASAAASAAVGAEVSAGGPSCCLLDACGGFDVLVALHLEAASLAQLGAASRADRARLSEGLVRWCAGRRRDELVRGLARGDLELAETTVEEEGVQEEPHLAEAIIAPVDDKMPVRWSLERLHLAERPPRFPRLYFHFASDELVEVAKPRLLEVLDLLRRFPRLRVRIEGYGKPSAPPELGRAVAQARAVATRGLLLQALHLDPGRCTSIAAGTNPWEVEDPCEGYYQDGGYDEGRGRANTRFYAPRLVGRKLQAIGFWGRDAQVRNENFQAEVELDEDWDDEAKFRRVDFTIIGLDDW